MFAQRSGQALLGLLVVIGVLFWSPATVLLAQSSDLSPTSHIVGRGETLSEVAKKYGLDAADLMELNAIEDPDAIFEGQELRLPLPLRAGDETEGENEHTILAGESLIGIARQYGIPVESLMAANNIVDPDTIVIGQRLSLPTAEGSGPVAPLTSTDPISDADDPDEILLPQAPRRPTATLNRTYTVEAGDNLARIALRVGVDEGALRALNRLQDGPVSLLIGDELLLPATGRELRVSLPSLEYTVQSGDSLGGIAREHDTTLPEMLQINNLTDPDAIVEGQQVIIPPRIRDGTEQRAPLKVGPGRNGFYHYTVRQGDSLSKLAREFESTILALLEYNDLPDEETVYEGLELRIPYGAPPVPQMLPPVPMSGTRFMVSLSRQQCWIFQGDMIKYTWNCSTGYGEWITRTGTFAIQSKLEMAQSNGLRLDMPYWLGIYDVGDFENGIHGLPVSWDTGEKIWTSLIGEPATFGCAMLADDDALALFNLAYLGMPVHIIN